VTEITKAHDTRSQFFVQVLVTRHCHAFCYQIFLEPETWAQQNKFYSSPETWDHVTQMQCCHWPLRFACIIMQCIICKLNGASYLFTNIYCVNFYQDFYCIY